MASPKPRTKGSLTIVIKLGTSSIVHETTHQPLLSTLSSVVETVVRLRNNGHKVVLVSSGAIGVGLKRMEIPVKPKNLAKKQALAAIGQGRLIALWDNLFSQLGQPIAQVLLTRGDISDRTRYLNAVNTLTELLSMGVVPIINENDTISVSEIRFGDNDTLSAITASMLHADFLFLLTDVDSLYTSNPRKDPSARRIDVVDSIPNIRKEVSTATLGSKLGTGGMETKLIAAEIATSAGVSTVVTTSKIPENIFNIIQYITANATTSAGTTEFGNSSPPPDPNPNAPQPPLLSRPPHTLFTPSHLPLSDLKAWTSHTLAPVGAVIIDMGAYRVLSRRDSGGRLLPAGVLAVKGTFASNQAVRILIRKTPDGFLSDSTTEAKFAYHHDSSTPVTRPTTPKLSALYAPDSMTSSISTLDAFSRQGSLTTLPANSGPDSVTPTELSSSATLTSFPSQQPTPEADEPGAVDLDGMADNGWEHIEVGRGLATYNSVEIRKARGCKSSQLATILGYADSEYVVENIVIRLLPTVS